MHFEAFATLETGLREYRKSSERMEFHWKLK